MAFTTSKSLLAKVRSGDEISWQEFYNTYKPLIYLCGGDCNLTIDEKEELVQKVMTEIFQKDILNNYDISNVPSNVVFTYDPKKGRFRHYLRGIIHNQAIKIYKKRKNNLSIDVDDSPVKDLPSPDQLDAAWQKEWQQHLLQMANDELKNRVKFETFVAFEMYALQNRSVEEVAEFLNMSISSVYTAKSRCITTLKEIIKELDEK